MSARRVWTFLGVVALFLLTAPVVIAAPSPGPPPAFDVPGGTAAFAAAVGIRPSIPRARLVLTAIRVMWETPEGADPAADRRRAQVLDYLRTLAASARAGQPNPERASGDAPSQTVPAYLPLETWTTILPEGGEFGGCAFAALLGNRRTALLYHGMAGVDPETLEYLAAHPEILRDLVERRAPLFATFGRSLRVRDGRVIVPGGQDAEPLWEAVAGDPVTKPAAFMAQVLGKGAGRLALLYDGLAHLDPGALRFALGLSLPAAERVERFQAFYEAASAALEQWKPADRPFERVSFDAVHTLLGARFESDGRAPGPAWRDLWNAVFDPALRLEDRDGLARAAIEAKKDSLDAAGLLEAIGPANVVVRRQRCEAWLFGSRVFRDAPFESAADLLFVLKSFTRFEALLLTLERMELRALPTYVAAVNAALRLSDADRRLWQFQAALSVLERARFSRAIDAATADALVRSLCALTAEGRDGYRGGLARWLEHDVLRAVPPSVLPAGFAPADRPLETRVLAAITGAVSSPANTALQALPPVEWEGLKYRFDPAGSSLRQLAAVRARQGGRSLDAVLALARLGDALAAAPSAAAAQSSARELEPVAAALRQAPGEIRPSLLPGGEPGLDDLLKETQDRARKLKSPPDAKTLARLAQPVLDASDWYLADVLGAIAYAPHLGDPSGPALLGGDPSRVHDFRFFKTVEANGRSAWQWPIEVRAPGIGWRVSGSLLGLDLALGRLVLRRVPRETIPEAPRLTSAMREAFVEDAILMVPFDLTEAAAQALRGAIVRGRQRVAGLGAERADADAAAAAAGLDEWRTGALRWMATHERDRRLELFSLAELARLGGLDASKVAGLDGFGTSGWSRNGALATSFPPSLPWTTLAGRRVCRGVPALVADLTLGIVQALERLGLHAPVAAGVLLFATQDYIDTLRTAHEDDWQEMVAHAQALAGGPIEDYVAGLTITGPLVPDETETRHER